MLTYAIQKVSDNDAPVEPQGATDLDGFLRALDAFPWADQHHQWGALQEGPLPAVILQHQADERELWVTALSADDEPGFQLVSVSMQTRKGLLGFGKATIAQDATLVDVDRRSDVELLCRLFCNAQYAEVDEKVRSLAQD